MRNLKKLLALIVTIAMLATFAIPAFAETTYTYGDQAAKLHDLGLYAGISATEFNPDLGSALTREQGMVLLLAEFGLTAKAAALTDAEVDAALANYTDAKDLSSWAKKAMAYAVINGITVGTTATTLGPKSSLTGEMLAAFIYRQLGYKDNYKTVVADLAAKGGLTAAEATKFAGKTLTRDDAVGFFFGALKATNSDGKTVAQVLIDAKVITLDQAVNAGVATAPIVAFAVESVKATDNKQFVITFNKDVDTVTGAVPGNYTLPIGYAVSGNPVVSGKTVTVTLVAAAGQQASINVTVQNVKDASGAVIATTTKAVTFFDATVPTAVSAAVSGPQTILVTFSEPITSALITDTANFVIDNNTYSVSSVAATGENAVTVTLGSTLPAGAHTIAVNNTGVNGGNAIKDYVGFYVAKTTLSFTYAVDASAPTVSLVSAAQNSVVIKFSKPIASNTGNLRVYHTYAGNTAYDYGDGAASWAVDGQTVTLPFTATYLPIGSVTIYVQNADAVAANQLKDAWGNAFVNATLTATVAADTTAPTVSSVVAASATSIDVTFSELVNGATTASNFTLKDAAGTAVAVTSSALKAGTTSTYTLTTAVMTGGSYTLSIAGITDTSVSANAMAAYSGNVAVTDLIAPTVTAAGVYSTDETKAIVKFSEAMTTSGVYSILNPANYQINLGTGLVDLTSVTGATIAAGAGNASVIITLPAADADLGDANPDVVVARVADAAGNVTAGFTSNVNLSVDNITTANISNIKAISQYTVQFDVDTTLSAIDVSKFRINVGGDQVATSATYVNGSGKATVTVSSATAFNTNLSNLTDVNFDIGGVTTTLGTSNNAKVTQAVTAATADYVAPTLNSTVTGDIDGDGHIDTIVATYSENLYLASVSEADYTVEGYVVTGVVAAGNAVTITVTELAAFDTAAVPKVALVGAISDITAQRNSLGAQAGVAATDGAKPVIVAATTKSANTVQLTYSENITVTAAAPTQWVVDVDGAGATVADVTSANTASAANAGKVVTLTLTTGGLTTGTAYAAATVVYTAGAAAVTDGTNAAKTPQTFTGLVSGF